MEVAPLSGHDESWWTKAFSAVFRSALLEQLSCQKAMQSQSKKNMSRPKTKIPEVHAGFFRVTTGYSSRKVCSLSIAVRFFGVHSCNSSRKDKSLALKVAMAG
jgi:hypothetical protein